MEHLAGRVVDGVQVLPDGRVAVTTWDRPGLWQLNADGTYRELVPGLVLPGAADFVLDRTRSRLPLENQLRAVDLPS
ncbi:hypothetical protein GCM10022247_38710 [Allokutzneria multivorans]|uniref:Uncharacterized protein n=1 Tax=Allokutzneria multivorans TaxID=1142134 RepID=A0ABP7SJI4_9PSEU